jgi:hypothetical protein
MATYSNSEIAGSTVLTILLMVSANRVTLKQNLVLWHSHVFVDKIQKNTAKTNTEMMILEKGP